MNISKNNSIIPPFLKAGDQVEIIAPAKFVSSKDIENAVYFFKQHKLDIIFNKTVFQKDNVFAGSILQRVENLNAAINNKKIKAIRPQIARAQTTSRHAKYPDGRVRADRALVIGSAGQEQRRPGKSCHNPHQRGNNPHSGRLSVGVPVSVVAGGRVWRMFGPLASSSSI